MSREKTHIELNNEVLSPEGQLNIEKDKQAVKKYFVDYINMNMVWFHDLEEKINYLLDNDYYSYELFSKYDILDVKRYSKKHTATNSDSLLICQPRSFMTHTH